MPTKNRLEAATVELSEKIERLGYDVNDVIGPIELESDNSDSNSEDESLVYYITVEGNSRFYIELNTNFEFGQISYPYSVARFVGRQLNSTEIEEITGESPEWDDSDNEEIEDIITKAGTMVISNTPRESLWLGKFNLSAYASTALVKYNVTNSQDGFPLDFKCSKGVFPYDNAPSLKQLDNGIEPVVIAGERGRRYAESAFIIDKEFDSPDNYELSVQF